MEPTAAESRAIELLKTTDLFYGDIAKAARVSKATVARLRRKYNLREPTPEQAEEIRKYDAQIAAAAEMVKNGNKIAHVARSCGITLGTLSSYCQRNKIRSGGARSIYIYALHCPDTNQIFYIGRARNPWTRFYQHLRSPTSELMREWIEALAKRSIKPHLSILDHVITDDPSQVESDWIKRMADDGHPLMNQVQHI